MIGEGTAISPTALFEGRCILQYLVWFVSQMYDGDSSVESAMLASLVARKEPKLVDDNIE